MRDVVEIEDSVPMLDAFMEIFGMKRVANKRYTVYGIYSWEGEISRWGGTAGTPRIAVAKAKGSMTKRAGGDVFTPILALDDSGKEVWRKEYYKEEDDT